MEHADIWLKVASGLTGLLTIAFLSWAGVVYRGAEKITSLLYDLRSDVRSVGERVRGVEVELDKHEAMPWHAAAGEMHQRQLIRLDHIDKELDRIAAKLDHLDDELSTIKKGG